MKRKLSKKEQPELEFQMQACSWLIPLSAGIKTARADNRSRRRFGFSWRRCRQLGKVVDESQLRHY